MVVELVGRSGVRGVDLAVDSTSSEKRDQWKFDDVTRYQRRSITKRYCNLSIYCIIADPKNSWLFFECDVAR